MNAAGGTCWRELLERVRAGDRQAGDELYHEVRRVLTPFLLTRCGPDRFEDYLHDLFARFLVMARGNKIRKPEAMVGLLLLAARQKIWDGMRAEMRSSASAKEGTRAHLDTPERRVIAIDQARKALAAMSTEERQACCAEGGADTASRSLGVSRVSVFRRRRSGRQKAAAAIGYQRAA